MSIPDLSAFAKSCLVLFLILPGVVTSSPATEPRTALVICVADYQAAGFHSLPGIDIDKNRMTEALQKTGFDVTTMFDPSLSEARTAVDDFINKLRTRGGVGLFYFSGHGVVAANHNHLLFGGEGVAKDFSNLWEEAISAQVVLRRMEQSSAATRIVLLDCCRHGVTEFSGSDLNNPMKEGSFIGYATSGESVPAHAEGSRYTESFARHMLKPGASLEDIQLLVNQDLSSQDGPYWSLPMFRDRLAASQEWSFHPGESAPVMVRPGQVREFGGIQFVWCSGESGLFPATEVKDGVVVPRKLPHHSVQNGFWISQTEVTRWQWQSLMGTLPGSVRSAIGEGALPVTNVSWNEAVSFCREMNAVRKDELPPGKTFNLPTEAQWEYAARAGTRTAYYFGNDPEGLAAHANYGKEREQFGEMSLLGQTRKEDPNSSSPFAIGRMPELIGKRPGGKPELKPATLIQTEIPKLNVTPSLVEEFGTAPDKDADSSMMISFEESVLEALFGSIKIKPQSLPVSSNIPFKRVGELLPNPWLLYDVYGNVAEWCLISEDEFGPKARGGSVFSSAEQCRAMTYVNLMNRDSRFPDVGFRIVISQEAMPEGN